MQRGTKSTTKTIGSIRIISGQWRGRKLPVLDYNGLRPTTDRTKETLFNWLMQHVQNSRCLDLFAGSGGLGFEALSRYAQSATFVEKNPAAARQLAQNIATLKLTSAQATLHQVDALFFLQQPQPAFDLIFIDPPFGQNMLQPCIDLINSKQLLSYEGLVYLEHEASLQSLTLPYNWKCKKRKNTKQVIYAIYEANNE